MEYINRGSLGGQPVSRKRNTGRSRDFRSRQGRRLPSLCDRYIRERKGVDVLLVTLDAERFLERSLTSLYEEVPVSRLIVCDGGSRDGTLRILDKFPRVELHIRPEIHTTGKAFEFLLSRAKSEWIMFTDADLTFPAGWYDEMCTYRKQFDAFDSKRIHAYEFYREDPATSRLDARPLVACPQMGRRKALAAFKVDDDYMWRITDIAARQSIEMSGYKYGKVTTTFHFHHTTEEIKYASDPSKAATKIVFEDPKEIVINAENWCRRVIDNVKAYVKYIDPDPPYIRRDTSIDTVLPLLDRPWVLEHGPRWIPRYDEAIKRAHQQRNLWRRLAKLLRRLASVHVRAILGAGGSGLGSENTPSDVLQRMLHSKDRLYSQSSFPEKNGHDSDP